MTKRDLIDEVNKRFPHLSRRDSEVIINAIFDSMVDALAQGDRDLLRYVGTFGDAPAWTYPFTWTFGGADPATDARAKARRRASALSDGLGGLASIRDIVTEDCAQRTH